MLRRVACTAALLVLAACADRVAGPAAQARPHFNLADSTGGGDSSALQPGLTWRSDSLVRGAYINWSEGELQYYLSFSEGTINHQRTAMVGYGVYRVYQCWDWWSWQWTTCWEPQSLGFGTVPARDVTGGAGAMAITTNTAPDANPGFWHYNDAGGVVQLSVRQVAGTADQWRYHDTWASWPLWSMTVSPSSWRAATVTGSFVGAPVPQWAVASLNQTVGHSITLRRP